MTLKYGLNIVFYMKSYPQFKLEDDFEFELDNLKFKLKKLNKVNGSYSLFIMPIEDMEHATKILNKIKLALTMFVLEHNWAAIEIDEDIKEAIMLDEPKYIHDDWLVSGDYTIDETTLIPLVSNLAQFKSHPFPLINYLDESKLVDSIDRAFSLDCSEINDEKLSLALEMYTKHSQFSRKRQFLDLVTILEILKPKYSVSSDSIDVIKLIKDDLKKYRESFDKNSDEYKEFDRYFHDMHFWESKSINKSLQQFVIEYQDEFEKYDDIDAKIKKVYGIRSNIVHNCIIDEEFDEYFDFLKDFVGKLIRIKLDYLFSCIDFM